VAGVLTLGSQNLDSSGNLEIYAAGKAIVSHSDGLHWVYQQLPDGGQIQARFLTCDFLSATRTAGLMVRQNLVSGSRR